MKIFYHIYGLGTLMLCFLSTLALYASAGDGSSSNKNTSENISKDTIQAVVMYGESFLLDTIAVKNEERIFDIRDSLISLETPPVALINQINLYLRIKHMSDEAIILMIDSLFEAEKVPYALINLINYHIKNKAKPEDIFAYTNSSKYPAHNFYKDWNTQNPNPYMGDIGHEDSTIYLLLQGLTEQDEFVPPVVNTITSKFGWRDGRNHNGIDIDLEVWDTVVAAFPGMVRVARFYGGYGRVVVIRHFNGLETTYAHLHRIKVKPGQVVNGGELIGLGGSSGNSTGSHLHFECRFKGVPLNPMSFISFKENKAVCDTLVLRKIKYGYACYPYGTKFHVVERGDYLYDIARRYGTTTSKLCELNGIRRNTMLKVGQTIRVI